MKKYRIKERDGWFTPQVKEFLFWRNLNDRSYRSKEVALDIIKFDYNLWNMSTQKTTYHCISEEELNDSN